MTDKVTMRERILNLAKDTVTKDRSDQYGNPEDNFALIAKYWSLYTGAEISAKDVAIMMTLLKIARITTGKHHLDNYTDSIGYLACATEIAEKENDTNGN